MKVLGYEWSGEKQSMDPADMHSGDDAYHIFAVYNRLVDIDDNFKILPELATEREMRGAACGRPLVVSATRYRSAPQGRGTLRSPALLPLLPVAETM